MSFLLDTNAVSEWTKPKPDSGLTAWLASADEDHIYLSVITLAEVKFGIERLAKGHRRGTLELWLKDGLAPRFEGRILQVNADIAHRWGEVVAACAGMGRPIGIMDGFIAATAIAYRLTLITRNTADFEHTGVSLLSPWAAKS